MGKQRKPVKRRHKPRKTRKRVSVLIIEGDASRLADQSLSLGAEVREVIRTTLPEVPVEMMQLVSTENALRQFGELCKARPDGFEIVALVAHSNRHGVCLADDLWVEWPAFSKWIEPFNPRELILIACEAGRVLPVRALFDGVGSLREVYGSPIITTKDQARLLQLLLLLLSGRRSAAKEYFLQLAALNFGLTGGIILKWKRERLRSANPVEELSWAALDQLPP